jgi:pimeloyl-ACP methyl ester carboxylesterase
MSEEKLDHTDNHDQFDSATSYQQLPDPRFSPEAGPTDNPLAIFNLGLETPPGPNPPSGHPKELPLTADFNRDHFHLTEEARERIAQIPETDRIKPGEELVPTAEQAEALKTPQFLLDPEAGPDGTHQQFQALKLNWREPDENGKIPGEVTVFLPAFLSDVAEGPTHLRVEQAALQMPDTPLLAINQPSQNGSDKLTAEQRQALDENGDLTPTAAAMLRAMQEQGITDINLVGTSMGAWTASTMAKIAHEYGITVHEMILIEPANTEVTTGKNITKNFRAESKFFDLYHGNPKDPELIKATKLDKSWIRRKLYEVGIGAKPVLTGRAKDTFGRFPDGMAAGSLQADLEAALQPGMHVTIANGGVSLISGTEANNAIADTITAQHPGQVERVVFSGETHSILESPKAYGAFVRQTLQLRRRSK